MNALANYLRVLADKIEDGEVAVVEADLYRPPVRSVYDGDGEIQGFMSYNDGPETTLTITTRSEEK